VHLLRLTPPLLAVLLASACSSLEILGIRQESGLEQVDELLSDVESVRAESALAKERAQAALECLRELIVPDFKGDAAATHARFVAAVEQSEEQADALQESVRPLRRTGEAVFTRWAEDLESFGNLAMRQRSQERLEETRRRYDAILAAAVSAQLAYDAYNGDLSDHALFLEHDFNATSVALVSQELDGLRSRGRELAKRLDACGAACLACVEFSAPSDQVSPAGQAATTSAEPEAQAQSTSEAGPKKPAPKRKLMLKQELKASPTSSGSQGG
jgi:hypothetical protein